MHEPSPYQQAIYEEVEQGTGDLVIVARAGAGKTSTIIEAINFIADDRRILLAAFNTDIRDELEKRAPKHAKVQTINGLGYGTLKFKDPRRTYADVEVDTNKPWRLTRKVLGDDSDPDHVDAVVKLVELAKAMLVSTRAELEALVEKHAPFSEATAAEVAAVLHACLDDKSCIDFNDQIWLPNIFKLTPPQYDYIFLDEAQDVTLAQLRLVQAARKPGGRVIAVGDPMQAIYTWRGAVEGIMDQITTELQAKVLTLPMSYRCAKRIVEEAQTIVPDIIARPDAPMGEVITLNWAAAVREIKPGDYLLSRNNASLVKAARMLRASGKHVRILGESGRALLSLVKRSKADDVETLDNWLTRHLERVRDRAKAHEERDSNGTVRSSPQLEQAEDNVEALRAFFPKNRGYTTESLKLDIEKAFAVKKSGSDDAVICSTTHKVKGQERARVFLLYSTYCRRPGPEEERILYVAITRAKDTLFYIEGKLELP